jgi:hypothetical protein
MSEEAEQAGTFKDVDMGVPDECIDNKTAGTSTRIFPTQFEATWCGELVSHVSPREPQFQENKQGWHPKHPLPLNLTDSRRVGPV